MKQAIIILSLVLICFSCSKEKNNSLYLLTRGNWTQYLDMHNGIVNPIIEIDELSFKTDKNFIYTIPNIFSENDTVYGSFELTEDTIKLNAFRKVLKLVEVDGHTEFHDTIFNDKQNWTIIELNENFLTVKVEDINFNDKNFVFIYK